MKLITPAVAELIQASQDGSLPAGNFVGDVGLTDFHDLDSQVSDDIKTQLSEIESGLLDDSISTGYNP
jgi:hypothetical protein